VNAFNQPPVYLDYNASTPLHPQVAALMQESLAGPYGNPSGPHWAGIPARERMDKARRQVADFLGCSADEIIFTSGGSESNNQVLKSTFFNSRSTSPHIITSRVEHPAIIEPCRFLESLGARITWLPVDQHGLVDVQQLKEAITPDTELVSIMHANNEVGTIQPIEQCARIAHQHGVLFHTDAAQSAGKIPTRVDELGVDFLSIAGHKLYAPKGIGALYVRRGATIAPLVHGAGHESGRRAGTESVLLASALGEACELARELSMMSGVQALRDHLWMALKNACGDRVRLNGHPEKRLPNTLNVAFAGQVGSELLAKLPWLAASTGSACHAGRVELSPVLEAMGVEPGMGMGAVRFSLGIHTTADEIETVIRNLIPLLN
jgi:cysteine desulfurase